MGSVRWMMQKWRQALDLPTCSCLVSSTSSILPHNHWQTKTLIALKGWDSVFKALFLVCVYQKQALQQDSWWEHGFTVICIKLNTNFSTSFSFHIVDWNCAVVASCLSKLPHQHFFYSNASQSPSNTRKHTSPNHKHVHVHKKNKNTDKHKLNSNRWAHEQRGREDKDGDGLNREK